MRPSESIPIKVPNDSSNTSLVHTVRHCILVPIKVNFPPSIQDYAIETPLKKPSTASDEDLFHQVKIEFNTNSSLAAINFVLKVCFQLLECLIF